MDIIINEIIYYKIEAGLSLENSEKIKCYYLVLREKVFCYAKETKIVELLNIKLSYYRNYLIKNFNGKKVMIRE